MTITEFAILHFKSPPHFSDPILQPLFRTLSAWQSECSGFPLHFFTNPENALEVHLLTGWESTTAHQTWIQGERNQALLRMFAPYVDIPQIRMVHIDLDVKAIPRDVAWMVVERYAKGKEVASSLAMERSIGYTWSLFGRDLAQEDGDMFRFVSVARSPGEVRVDGVSAPIERWVLERIDVES